MHSLDSSSGSGLGGLLRGNLNRGVSQKSDGCWDAHCACV